MTESVVPVSLTKSASARQRIWRRVTRGMASKPLALFVFTGLMLLPNRARIGGEHPGNAGRGLRVGAHAVGGPESGVGALEPLSWSCAQGLRRGRTPDYGASCQFRRAQDDLAAASPAAQPMVNADEPLQTKGAALGPRSSSARSGGRRGFYHL